MACMQHWMASAWLPRLGAKPPSSPTGRREALLVEQLLQCVEDLGAAARRFAERRHADRHDHEFPWMSRLLLACAPPLMMFIIGTGMDIGPGAAEIAVERQAGSSAAALATAIETASMALAPRRDLLSVPSRSIRVLSMKACSCASAR